MTKRSWVQDPDTGKLIPKEEWNDPRPETAAIHGDIEPFLSTVDGSRITSRSGLRAHNARHGVTDTRDYSDRYMLDRTRTRVAEMTGQTKAARDERRKLIAREIDRNGR